ncbi:alpha/beta fold hydrolase [Curtobacterium pusillum]|uniref:alpha/beta fold hydrolase n=1 Tax=Curtobacterium pusillum TaxID=69373 RepID=UPI0011A1D488|nr:alpha/beta hydrolase [Curtobacterium pusillum]
MIRTIASSSIRFVEHGAGRPVVVLHGAGVDHREAEVGFEPALDRPGVRRIYLDLPGMGQSPADGSVRSAADVVTVLVEFVEAIAREPVLLVGHSAGGYLAQAVARSAGSRVAGLALVCPLLASAHDVPAHQPVVAAPELGDEGFRDYFVVQTPELLERYERYVAPALPLADGAFLERTGATWEVDSSGVFHGPMLVVAGRQDSTAGFAAAAELVHQHPHATLAVLDGAGHALPHEQPAILKALLGEWLTRATQP